MAHDFTDEAEYAQAISELRTGHQREGLWGKAFVDARGDEERTKVWYLKYRVAQIKEENRNTLHARIHAEAVEAEAARRAAAAVELERQEIARRIIRQLSKRHQ